MDSQQEARINEAFRQLKEAGADIKPASEKDAEASSKILEDITAKLSSDVPSSFEAWVAWNKSF